MSATVLGGPPELDLVASSGMRLRAGKISQVIAERWAGIVALAFIFTSGALGVRSAVPSQAYTTRTGETRLVQLDDGSQVQLNTRTRLEAFADATERHVALRAGEAYFDVKPDPERPFRLELSQSDIQVLGTRFDVYQKPNGQVRVTVLEGSVLVQGHPPSGSQPAWHRELYAHQQIEYGPEGLIQDTMTLPDTDRVTRWRDGAALFDNTSLPEVLEELSRYTDHPLIIRDERLKKLQVGGVISTHDIRATLRRLEKHAPVAVTEEGNAFILRYRDPDR